MICYKDMSFCGSDCVNSKCNRHFGPKHKEQSRKWWSHDPDNAPVAFIDFSTTCKDYRHGK